MGVECGGGDYLTAEATGNPFRPLCGQRKRQIVHAIYPGCPVSLAAPGLVIGLRARGR